MKVTKILSPDPISVDRAEPLAKALGALDELGIRHLPVQEEGRLVGIVSERDLLERDFGDEWVEEMEEAVQKLIDKALQPE